jgi:hypothetical protein
MTLGALIIAGLLLGVLLQTPERVIASNSVTIAGELGSAPSGSTVCQAGERLPASTQTLRVSLAGYLGPEVSLSVLRGGVAVARGEHHAEWVGGSLTFGLRPAIRSETAATICITRDSTRRALSLLGGESAPGAVATEGRTPLAGRMRVEYLTRGNRSWLASAESVARRLGLGHSPGGTWIVLLLVAMMACACVLGTRLLIGEERDE